MLSVMTNIAAVNANRQLKLTDGGYAKSAEKLSSGYRINRAADDAAGLTISEKMRRQIRGLARASKNAEDGISMIQTAEGALTEVHAMLQRMNELAIQAANGTLTDADREAVDAEIQQLKDEIDGTGQRTEFNKIKLFPPEGGAAISAAADGLSEAYNFSFTLDLKTGNVTLDDFTMPAVGNGAAGGVRAASNGEVAKYVAEELIPKAAKQIFDAFWALGDNIGTLGANDKIKLEVSMEAIDGAGNTLARAGYSYYHYPEAGQDQYKRAVAMCIEIDSADFTAADIDPNHPSAKSEALESTIAHEFMHSVMQFTLTDGMSGRNPSLAGFPEWFIEGTAQLAGGGFPTNWNNDLKRIAQGLTSGNTSKDSEIAAYLRSDTVANRPYGHGYLAAAYAGYLAANKTAPGGGTAVTGSRIAEGMNAIFIELLKPNTSLDAAFSAATGKTTAQIVNEINTGASDAVKFVRELTIATGNGAGSVITANLSDGGTNIIGDISAGAAKVETTAIGVTGGGGGTGVGGGTGGGGGGGGTGGRPVLPPIEASREIRLQVGADTGNMMIVGLYSMRSASLGLGAMDVLSQDHAETAIDTVAEAISKVSEIRSYYGAMQNRLEHTIANLDNAVENTTASESRIRDTDMASEMVSYSKSQILLQAGQSLLAQANQSTQGILSLLS